MRSWHACAQVLVGAAAVIGKEEPLSYEKLCPVLGLYRAKTWDAALDMAHKLVNFGGAGHTSCLYTSVTSKERISQFQKKIDTVRILINSPASQG
jgi:acetaldehyde dehydrogenase / alcohol dehydrogenase